MNRIQLNQLLPYHIPHAARAVIARILEEEQGENKLIHDRGGYTNWGISSRWYPHLNISQLSASAAGEIYYKDYWLFNKCHQLPIGIAYVLFDTAVNQGGDFARKTLQQVLGVKADGIIGPKTIDASNRTSDPFLVIQYTRYRCMRYTNLVQKDKTQIIFIEGWIDRALEILIDAQLAEQKP